MKISRIFTKNAKSAYELFKYTKRSSTLRNPDGSIVFHMDNIEVPVHWSQVATDVLAQKYFRKTGVPLFDEKGNPIYDSNGKQALGSETSIKQVVHRLAGTWRHWGEKYKYFDTSEDAQNFYDETVYMLLNQMAAPNSPQWFNTGLAWAYGIKGNKQGHYYIEPETGKLKESKDAYSRPQPHACFIQSIKDDLLNEGGIFDLVSREARIFKFGSGSGTNFSPLRAEGEPLSGGGKSSGLMSFLKIYDRAAGSIKSGGTTRRAAKMVIVDIDHPDVEQFIEWKAREEEKVAALVTGSRINSIFLKAIFNSVKNGGSNLNTNKELRKLIQKALHRGVLLNYIHRVIRLAENGVENIDFEIYDTHYESEAYTTVSGQNSNNSVRVSNEFMKAVEENNFWELRYRVGGGVAKKVKARELWDKMCLAAWKSADPGLQFDTTINEWHTCPKSGRINASNPCSEYMFLDDTACNLASLNLIKFYDEEKGIFKVDEFRHAIRIWTIILEISVLMAQFPSKKIAQLSYEYRTLGLGYANLGTLLMVQGVPYDSPEALAITGAITAILTGEAYRTSAEMAKELGPFPGFEKNREDMLRVIRNHRRCAYNAQEKEYESLTIKPMGINPKYCPEDLLQSARKVWDEALELGETYGFRNAQVSAIAPTGTIALIMDCDTTGIEPDFAIVKFKKLSGGGYFKIVNQSVHKALIKLGYTESQIEAIEKYTKGHGTLIGCPTINHKKLLERGFTQNKVDLIEKQLDNVFDIRFAFNRYVLGDDFCKDLGFSEEDLNNPNFDLLSSLGFTEEEIEIANEYVCGTMMLEGAPFLKPEHLPIFDTAVKCGKKGTRFIPYMAHIRMMASAQPFISGAISKTVNMPSEATVEDIGKVYFEAWKMMLKSITIYRDGSKLSQPLNTTAYEGFNEIVMLGDEESLDETLGPSEVQSQIAQNLASQQQKPQQQYKLERRRLPKLRHGFIREATIGGHKVYLRTGEYEDGTLGEIFIDMYKEGAAFRGLLNSFAILASKALQYGLPLDELVDTFTFTRFDPSGPVEGHEAIKYATSVLDYVFRSLGYDYLKRTDFIHTKAVDELPPGMLPPPKRKGEPKNKDFEFKDESTSNKKIDESKIEEGNSFPDELVSIEQIVSSSEAKATQLTTAAKGLGYTGEFCPACGSIRMRRSGTCSVCEDCGTNTGCS
ncbi:MAG: vitamin B12-dependent ribonucleotide reductase [Ignavibacteria bacterium]|nr:vitamin B12-dependent ribonucleotide reductase [Ignavibacteria bacterium]